MARHYSNGRVMSEPSERKSEARDSGMLSEDRSAIANMPQKVMYHEWGGSGSYLMTNLDDTKSGIDKQKNEDVNMLNRHKAKSMY